MNDKTADNFTGGIAASSEGYALNWFIRSAAMILLITGITKVWAAFGEAKLLTMADPIVGIQFGHLMFAVGIAELAAAALCLFSKTHRLAMMLVAWLVTNFVVYRLGLWWMNWHRPCSCLGNLTDALHISPQVADNIMKVVLAYLLIGSYGLLFWQWRQFKLSRIESLANEGPRQRSFRAANTKNPFPGLMVIMLLMGGRGLISICSAASNPAAADLFKSFCSGDFPIKELVGRLEIHEVRRNPEFDTTYFVYLRLQSNALLFATSLSPFPTNMPSGFKEGSIVSRFDDFYWYRYYRDVYEWRSGGEADDGNVVARNFSEALASDVARMLNMGCDFLPAFGVTWRGDSFMETNVGTGFIVTGELTRDRQGRAEALMVGLEKPGSPTLKLACRCDYSYTEPLSLRFLPNKITKGPTVGGSPNDLVFVWELTLLDVRLASAPLEKADFSLTEHTNGVNTVFTVSDGNLIYSKDGAILTVPDTQSRAAMAQNERAATKALSRSVYVRGALVLVFALTLVIPFVFWRQRMSAS